jgi:hypothetical protein
MATVRTGTKNEVTVYIELDEGEQDIFVGALQTPYGARVTALALETYLRDHPVELSRMGPAVAKRGAGK